MVQSKSIVEAFERLQQSDFTCVYPVVQFCYPIWRCLDLAEDGTMKRHWSEYENSRSQDLPKEYHDTGTFYWYKTKEWLAGNIKIGGIEVEETTIQDIDTETDWKLAEMKYKLIINPVGGDFYVDISPLAGQVPATARLLNQWRTAKWHRLAS